MKRGYSGDFNSLLPPLDKKKKATDRGRRYLKGTVSVGCAPHRCKANPPPGESAAALTAWYKCVCVCVAAQINCTNALLVRRQLVYFGAFWTDVLSTVRESVQLSEASLAAEEEDVLVFGTTSLERAPNALGKHLYINWFDIFLSCVV